MIQIRQGVFETNSSSTHAISIVTKEQWDDLQNGSLLVHSGDITVFCDADTPGATEEDKWGDRYLTYGELYDNHDYDFFKKEFTTPSGDEMVVWGYYGYDC